MADTTTKLIIDGDPNGLVAAMNRAKGAVKDGADDMVLSGAGIARSLAGAAAGFVSFAAAAAVMGIAVRGFIENEHAVSQLEARLKSTNGVAGQTSEGLQEMASALQKTTTFADDMTIAAQALLLTFTNVRGPIFEEAIVSIQDMSIALGQDLQSSTIQLGKALNDPIKGITALSRVGVSFTAEQKETIKTMVEMGNVTGAQKLILQELQVEFGGAAAAAKNTLGGALTSLNNAFGDMLESVVGSGLEGGGIIGGIHSLTEAFENSKPVVHTFQAEIIRMAMLADKAGGSLTALGYASSKIAFAGTKFFTIGNFGDGFDGKATKFNSLNKMFEERYKANERALQGLANQEVGLDIDGNPIKPKAGGSGGGPPSGGGGTIPKWVEAGISNLEALRAAKLKIFAEMVADEAEFNRINANGGLTGPQQKKFNLASDASAIKARKAASDREDEQAEFDHVQTMAGFANSLLQAKLDVHGKEREALDAQFDFEKSQLVTQMQWKLDHTYLEEYEKERIREEFAAKKRLLEAKHAKSAVDIAKEEQDMKFRAANQYAQASMNLTNALYVFGGSKSKALFNINKAAGIANATVGTYTGAAQALRDVPYPYNIAAMASVIAAGLAQVAQISSTEFNSGGGAASGGTGGGTAVSPIVTQPIGNQTSAVGSTTIIFQGNVMDKAYIEEQVIPLMNDAGTRNIRVEYLA